MKTKKRLQYVNCDKNGFAGSQVLSTAEMRSLAFNTNYFLGRGRELIPYFSPDISGSIFNFDKGDFNQGYTQIVFYLCSMPSTQSIERAWSFGFNSLSGSSVIAFVDDGTNPTVFGSASVNALAEQIELIQPMATFVAPLVSGTMQTKVGFRLSGSILDSNNDKFCPFPTYIACNEIDRPSFDPVSSSQEGGVDEDSFAYNATLFDAGQSQYSSLVGLARNMKLAQERTHRSCLFTFSRPIEVNGSISDTYGYPVTSSSLQTIGKWKAVMSPRYRNETTGSLRVFVAGGLKNPGGTWGAELIISTSVGVTTGTFTAGNAADEDYTSWKVFDVPLYRQNISSSWGGSKGGESLSLLDVVITGRLTGTFGSGFLNLFTIQGFDTNQ